MFIRSLVCTLIAYEFQLAIIGTFSAGVCRPIGPFVKGGGFVTHDRGAADHVQVAKNQLSSLRPVAASGDAFISKSATGERMTALRLNKMIRNQKDPFGTWHVPTLSIVETGAVDEQRVLNEAHVTQLMVSYSLCFKGFCSVLTAILIVRGRRLNKRYIFCFARNYGVQTRTSRAATSS